MRLKPKNAGDPKQDAREVRAVLQSISENKEHFRDKPVNGTSSYHSGTLLTRREKEVLILLAEGFTTLKIAEGLFISKHTVNTHRSNLMNKLHAKNIARLISQGFRHGILK